MNYIIGQYYINIRIFTVHIQFYYMLCIVLPFTKCSYLTPPEMYFCISEIKFVSSLCLPQLYLEKRFLLDFILPSIRLLSIMI